MAAQGDQELPPYVIMGEPVPAVLASDPLLLAGPPLLISQRSTPSAAHVPTRRASSSATACRCTAASSSVPSASASPSTWDQSHWSRHFAEVDQAESYASVLSFQLEEAVESEDFAEAVDLKRAILEATANDVVAHVMSELKVSFALTADAKSTTVSSIRPPEHYTADVASIFFKSDGWPPLPISLHSELPADCSSAHVCQRFPFGAIARFLHVSEIVGRSTGDYGM